MKKDRRVDQTYPSAGAAALAGWCVDHDVTTKALSLRAGFRTDVVARVIAGERGMSETTIGRLAAATNLDADLLRGRSTPTFGPLADVLRGWCAENAVSGLELARRVDRSEGFKRILQGRVAYVDRALLDRLENVTGLDLSAFKVKPCQIASLADAKAAVVRALGERHEIVRDLERFERGVMRRLEDIPALREAIEPEINTSEAHRRFDITIAYNKKTGRPDRKRWTNFRRNVLRSLELLGTAAPAHPSRQLGAEWAQLFEMAKPFGKGAWAGVARLARVCDSAGIAPADVDDDALQLLRADLDGDPRRFGKGEAATEVAIRRAISRWNKLADHLESDGWPQRRLTPLPPLCFRYTTATRDLPQTLREELARYETWAAGHTPDRALRRRFDAPGAGAHRDDPIELVTAQRHTRHVAQAAKALVETGHTALADLQSIADVVTVANARVVLKDVDRRHRTHDGPNRIDPDKSAYIQTVAGSLFSVAQFYLRFPLSELEELAGLLDKAKPTNRRNGITELNLNRLRQFDAHRIRRFLRLPSEIVAEYVRRRSAVGEVSADMASLLREAVALLILRICPLRRTSVGRLRWRHHFVQPGVRGDDGWLVVPAHMTKSKRSIERPISPTRWRVLEMYMKEAQPLLRLPGDVDNDHVFPSPVKPHAHLNLDHFSQVVAGTIRRRLDVSCHLHLTRHLLAWILLREDTSLMQTISTVLDHSSTAVTERFYAEIDGELATRDVDAMLDNVATGRSAAQACVGRKR